MEAKGRKTGGEMEKRETAADIKTSLNLKEFAYFILRGVRLQYMHEEEKRWLIY